jgi:DNA-binding transcriptional regulator of glucitol operon
MGNDAVSAATLIILFLAGAWFIQYISAFFQLRRFYRRIAELRRQGKVWIGMEGSAWKGRQYAVLVVDKDKHIVHVEQLSGWTVLASLKPVYGLEGRPISDLMDDTIEFPVSKKLLLALRNAVKHIQEAEKRAEVKANAEATMLDDSLKKSSA